MVTSWIVFELRDAQEIRDLPILIRYLFRTPIWVFCLLYVLTLAVSIARVIGLVQNVQLLLRVTYGIVMGLLIIYMYMLVCSAYAFVGTGWGLACAFHIS